MSFVAPSMLLLLGLIPIIALVYLVLQWQRRSSARRFAQRSLIKQALGKGPGWRRHLPAACLMVGLTFMLVGLARPQATAFVPAPDSLVVLAMDVSGSMGAEDLQPNRLEAMKRAARAFIEKQPRRVEVAIVTFSDNAFVVQPPTTDHDALTAAIHRIQLQKGTALGRGLDASLELIEEKNGPPAGIVPAENSPSKNETPEPTPMPAGTFQNASIVLLSDGENNQAPEPMEIAQKAADRGVRVDTVGIGSPEGAIVQNANRSMRTRLDEDTLRQISERTGGAYYNAQSEQALEQIYTNLATRLVMKTEQTDVTLYATVVALVFLLLAGFLSVMWFSRLP